MNKEIYNRDRIKEKYKNIVSKNNTIKPEELNKLHDEASHILDYIKSTKKLNGSSMGMSIEAVSNAITQTNLDNIIAEIVYEIIN